MKINYNLICIACLITFIFSLMYIVIPVESQTDDSIYVASDNILYKINSATGEILYKVVFNNNIKISDILHLTTNQTIVNNINDTDIFNNATVAINESQVFDLVFDLDSLRNNQTEMNNTKLNKPVSNCLSSQYLSNIEGVNTTCNNIPFSASSIIEFLHDDNTNNTDITNNTFTPYLSKTMNRNFDTNEPIKYSNLSIVGNGDFLVQNWTSPILNLTLIPSGVHSLHIHAEQIGGVNRNINIYYKCGIVNNTGFNLSIRGTSESNLLVANTINEEDLSMLMPDQNINLTDRMMIEVWVSVSGNGALPTLSLSYDDLTDSRLTFPTTQFDLTPVLNNISKSQQDIINLQNNDTYTNNTLIGLQNNDTYTNNTLIGLQNNDTYTNNTLIGLQNNDTYTNNTFIRNNNATYNTSTLNYIIGDGTNVITTGIQGVVFIPNNLILIGHHQFSDIPCSINMSVEKNTSTNYLIRIPTQNDRISLSVLNSGLGIINNSIFNIIQPNTILQFNTTSISGCKRVTESLIFRK